MSKKDLDNKIIQAGMFNDKATDAERSNKLRDLISKDMTKNVIQGKKDNNSSGGSEGEDEDSCDEIFTDHELNYELARTEDEREMFEQMDRERYEAEGRQHRLDEIKERMPQWAHRTDDKINYRLVQDWEVPAWIDVKKEEEKQKNLEGVELGKRKRNEVYYSDIISEKRWLQIVDAGGDPEAEKERILKRRKQGLADSESEAEPEPEQSEVQDQNPEERQD